MTRAFRWLSCRIEEWARRPGASPPMRMAASWSGSPRVHRIQACGAMIRARGRAPPRKRRAPNRGWAAATERIATREGTRCRHSKLDFRSPIQADDPITERLAINTGLFRCPSAAHPLERVGQRDEPAGDPTIVLQPRQAAQLGGRNIVADRQCKPGASIFRRLGISWPGGRVWPAAE